jgi:hypothetical protein
MITVDFQTQQATEDGEAYVPAVSAAFMAAVSGVSLRQYAEP